MYDEGCIKSYKVGLWIHCYKGGSGSADLTHIDAALFNSDRATSRPAQPG